MTRIEQVLDEVGTRLPPNDEKIASRHLSAECPHCAAEHPLLALQRDDTDPSATRYTCPQSGEVLFSVFDIPGYGGEDVTGSYMLPRQGGMYAVKVNPGVLVLATGPGGGQVAIGKKPTTD